MDIQIGTKGCVESIVCSTDTALAAGSGTLEVLSTPRMIALLENAACSAIAPLLDTGITSVGTQIAVDHVSATPVGMHIRAEGEVTAVDGRKITFAVRAFDEAGLIGQGVHVRFLVQTDKFLAKCQHKTPCTEAHHDNRQNSEA